MILPIPEYFGYINNEKFSTCKSIRYLYYRLKTSLSLRVNNYKKHTLHSEQVVFRSIKKIISICSKKV